MRISDWSSDVCSSDLAKRRGGLGVLEHRAAAGGMDGENRRFERTQRLDRLADGVGDIVELEIEEDRQADLVHLVDARAPVRHEEFEAQLDPADMAIGQAACGEKVLQHG